MCTSIKVIFLGVDIFALRSERQSRALRERILLTLRRYNTITMAAVVNRPKVSGVVIRSVSN